jgi:hypothetical protein
VPESDGDMRKGLLSLILGVSNGKWALTTAIRAPRMLAELAEPQNGPYENSIIQYRRLSFFKECLLPSDGRGCDCMWLTPTRAETSKLGISAICANTSVRSGQTSAAPANKPTVATRLMTIQSKVIHRRLLCMMAHVARAK